MLIRMSGDVVPLTLTHTKVILYTLYVCETCKTALGLKSCSVRARVAGNKTYQVGDREMRARAASGRSLHANSRKKVLVLIGDTTQLERSTAGWRTK